MRVPRAALAAGFAVMIVPALLLGASSANAATSAGRVGGYATFAYHSLAYEQTYGPTGPDGLGSETGFSGTMKDLAGYTFLSLGSGRGAAVKNNAAYVFNDTAYPIRVYYNSYTYQGCWCGTYVAASSGQQGGLGPVANQNAALRFITGVNV